MRSRCSTRPAGWPSSTPGPASMRMRCAASAARPRLRRSDPRVLYNLATALIAVGELQEAERLLSRVIALDPHDCDAYYNRATLRQQTNADNHVDEILCALDRPALSEGRRARAVLRACPRNSRISATTSSRSRSCSAVRALAGSACLIASKPMRRRCSRSRRPSISRCSTARPRVRHPGRSSSWDCPVAARRWSIVC